MSKGFTLLESRGDCIALRCLVWFYYITFFDYPISYLFMRFPHYTGLLLISVFMKSYFVQICTFRWRHMFTAIFDSLHRVTCRLHFSLFFLLLNAIIRWIMQKLVSLKSNFNCHFRLFGNRWRTSAVTATMEVAYILEYFYILLDTRWKVSNTEEWPMPHFQIGSILYKNDIFTKQRLKSSNISGECH